jgi:hypothetical protein
MAGLVPANHAAVRKPAIRIKRRRLQTKALAF